MMKLRSFIMSLFDRNALRAALATILLLNTNIAVSYASFDDLGVGGRATGMADSFVGAADDLNALYYNPAGLIFLNESEVTTEYGQLLKGLDDGSSLRTTYLGYGQPIRNGEKGYFAVAYHNFKAANLLTERTIMASYGWKLKIEPFGFKGLWSMGATLKQLYRQYEPDRFTENALYDDGTGSGEADPLFARQGYDATAYSADLGTLVQFGPARKYSAGLALRNINQPDVSIGGDDDKAPLATRLGFAYKPRWGLMTTEFRRVSRIKGTADTDIAVGAERKFVLKDVGSFAVRGGYASGSRGYKAVTAGVSYQLNKAQMDYAFNFPVGALADTKGSHRVGVSFKMGSAIAKSAPETSLPDTNIITLFKDDGLTAHDILKRSLVSYRAPAYDRQLFMQLLVHKYGQGAASNVIGDDLAKLTSDPTKQLYEWADLKLRLVESLPRTDQPLAEDTLEYMKRGDSAGVLARLALLSETGRKQDAARFMGAIALGELAARSYRAGKLDSSIDAVRQVIDIVPNDDSIMKAYRELLLARTAGTTLPAAEKTAPAANAAEETPAAVEIAPQQPELPEAPQTLVAPQPVIPQMTPAANENEVMLKVFGATLGYYLTRKAQGASAEERRALLMQMKTVFGKAGVDLSIVNSELKDLGEKVETKKTAPEPEAKPVEKKATEAPKPKAVVPAAPVKPATAAPAKKPAATSTAMTPEMEQAWQFYRRSVERGISDAERIELLEGILMRFGESTASKVNEELERIRRRSAP